MSTLKEKAVTEERREEIRPYAEGSRLLEVIGFQLDDLSKHGVHGRFRVGHYSTQPFGVLHGGVTAYVAEAIASIGAEVTANFQRIAGIELNINHLRAVPVDCEVKVDAVPILAGNRIQVWEVKFSTDELVDKKKSIDLSDGQKSETLLIAVARLTLLVGLPKPGAAETAAVTALSAKL